MSSSLRPTKDDRRDLLRRTDADDAISSSVMPSAAADIAPRSPPNDRDGEGDSGDSGDSGDPPMDSPSGDCGDMRSAGGGLGAHDIDDWFIGDVPD
tara:strand:- start:230 stop:517 length:288 start_codon:yes stop_codon:yes gene_type:complete